MTRNKERSQVYDLNNPDTIAYLNSQKQKFEKFRDRSSGQANETERSLSGQLILLTTVLITINVVTLGNSGLLDHMSVSQKTLVLVAFLLEAIATFAGIYHYFRMEKSYNKWGDAYHQVTLIFDRKEFSTDTELAQEVFKAQENLDIHPPRPAMNVQIISIILSFIVYFGLLVAVFFDFHGTFAIEKLL